MSPIRHRRPISLSLLSLDLPTAASIETSATIYENERDRFHILLAEPAVKAVCHGGQKGVTDKLGVRGFITEDQDMEPAITLVLEEG